MKLKFRIEQFKPAKMVIFADWCGGTLARAHARSGEPAMISGYLGKADTFDQAIAAFAVAYADQVERDYESFKKAVIEGKLEARTDRGHLTRAGGRVADGRPHGRAFRAGRFATFSRCIGRAMQLTIDARRAGCRPRS